MVAYLAKRSARVAITAADGAGGSMNPHTLLGESLRSMHQDQWQSSVLGRLYLDRAGSCSKAASRTDTKPKQQPR